MRIAQITITRNYKNSLQSSLTTQAAIINQGSTGLAFQKLSDNVSDGTRAMRIQEERLRAEAQLSTVEAIQLEFNSVDSNMDSIESILQTAAEKVLKAMSEEKGEEGRMALATEIENLKDQILQFANAQFGGKYLFSGQNNAEPPFGEDPVSGKLTFNGIEVDRIYTNNGDYVYMDGATERPVPDSGDIYMDIGLGLTMQGDEPDPRTAFEVSFNGLEIFGFGAAETGEHFGTEVSNNVYDLLNQLVESVTDNDKNEIDDQYTHLVELTDNMRLSRTELGTRMNFLERTEERLTNDINNLEEMETSLISSDPAEQAIDMKMAEYVWLATLQMGSNILPTSLLDFLG